MNFRPPQPSFFGLPQARVVIREFDLRRTFRLTRDAWASPQPSIVQSVAARVFGAAWHAGVLAKWMNDLFRRVLASPFRRVFQTRIGRRSHDRTMLGERRSTGVWLAARLGIGGLSATHLRQGPVNHVASARSERRVVEINAQSKRRVRWTRVGYRPITCRFFVSNSS